MEPGTTFEEQGLGPQDILVQNTTKGIRSIKYIDMKKFTPLIGFFALLMFMPTSLEAQFLKKLKERAKEAAERTILNRTDEEASKSTDKAIDEVLKGGKNKKGQAENEMEIDEEDVSAMEQKLKDLLGGLEGMEGGTPSTGPDGKMDPKAMEKALETAPPAPEDKNIQLPDTYDFSYRLNTQVTMGKEKEVSNYLLQPGKTYYAGMSTESGGTKYVIHDDQNLTLLHFLEKDGSTEFWREKMSVFTAIRMMGAYRDGENRQIRSLGQKELLGFKAEGHEIKTSDRVMELWVTHDAPATLFGSMFSTRSKMEGSPFKANDMILEMKFSSAENPDRNYTWSCTLLEPHSKVFDITAYNQ